MNIADFKPLKDKVLVLLDGSEEATSAGGLVIPAVAHQHIYQGRVIAVGPETRDVKVNDVVMMGKFGRQPIDLDFSTGKHVLISETDIVCVMEAAA